MKTKELQLKNIEDLVSHIGELKQKLHEKRMQAVMGNLKEIKDISNTRKEIARAKTLIAQKKAQSTKTA